MDSPYESQSLVSFFIHALGHRYLVLLPLAGMVSFALTLLVLIKGKGPSMGALVVLLVLLPLTVGYYGYIDGLISSYSVIAASETMPKPSELSNGVSMSLVSMLVGFWMSLPTLVLSIAGLTVRALKGT
jgi:hypothetical protein